MSEKEFKINDIVRVKDTPCPEWMQNMPALPDTLFKVEDIHDGKLTLSVDGSNAYFIVDARHFELVETPDQPKNMGDMSYEPINETESYIVNQVFGDSYIRASSNRIEMKGEIKDRDPKTAFLSELKGILSKYNACMWVQGGTDANLIISLNGEESVIPNMCGVNADNIDTIKNKIWEVRV